MGKHKKGFILTFIIVSILFVVGVVFASTTANYHYVLDVVKDTAVSKDEKLQITETIKKDNKGDYGAKELNYEVELKNISQEEEAKTEVAILIDDSNSMAGNETFATATNTAVELTSDILSDIYNSSVSMSKNSGVIYNRKSSYTSANYNAIKSLTATNTEDVNKGLDFANGTFSTTSTVKTNRYLIVLTDSTDDISEKLKELQVNNPDLHIISLLIDLSSNTYINDSQPVCGEVYSLYSDSSNEPTTEVIPGLKKFNKQQLYDEMASTVDNIDLTNDFIDNIIGKYKLSDFFEIKDVNVTNGTVNTTDSGYTWHVDRLRSQKTKNTEKLTFTLRLKTENSAFFDAGVIFEELCTNKEQKAEYQTFDDDTRKELNGTDAREGTESTVIRICQGYDLKLKAVNESNTDLPVEGVSFQVKGKNENGDEVCNITKKTDADGYITITADEAMSLRSPGTISYEVIPTVNNLVGYTSTDLVTFGVTNDRNLRKLIVDDKGSKIIMETPIEEKRLVEVKIPINTERIDLEINTVEYGNTNTTISNCEFQLIQPKLNNKYEMEVLTGITDDKGILHFSPTVMTIDGTYEYILRQVSAPNDYDVTGLALLKIEFKNGKIQSQITTVYNSNVSASLISENHVLVNVQNECVAQDPFNLQINLKDIDTKDPLPGVTYSVSVTNSKNQVRTELVKTDVDGQINTNVYGTGPLRIEITEQSPKTGYIADTKTKALVIERNNNIINVWENKDNIELPSIPTKDYIVANLYSKKKSEQNILRVSLVEKEENDVTVGPGVIYSLKDNETGTMYDANPIATDRNGELCFTVPNKEQGTHEFSLIVDTDSIPEEYDDSKVATNIRFNLQFDNGGYIIGENVIDNATVIKEEYSKVSNDSNTEYTCYITIGYELNISNTFVFNAQLKDKTTLGAIRGAAYDIELEWEINGVTKTKTIKNRTTNYSGLLTTRGVKGDKVNITIEEISAAVGYKCDNTTYEVNLIKMNNGTLRIDSQTTVNDLYTGFTENNGTITFNHLNEKRTMEDTYLNLTINKVTTEGQYVDGVYVKLSSDKLVDKDGNKLNLIKKSGEQGSQGEISIDFQKYMENDKNYQDIIRAPGIGTQASEMQYNLDLVEMEANPNDPTGFTEKPSTKVTLRLIFRENNGRVRLTNCETVYGNRLINQETKRFSSFSDDTQSSQLEDKLGMFAGNVYIDYYTNYDEVGNLSVDLKKTDINSNKLTGAKYNIKIVNPDGIVIRKDVTIDNGDGSQGIELTGVSVNVGSYIYLTEKTAPIGYAINQNTETLYVKAIDTKGEIILEHVDDSYKPTRLKMTKLAPTKISDDLLKTNYQIDLTDYTLDIFKFGIKAVDSSSFAGIEGYGFKIDSSLGAQSTIETNKDGEGETIVGGSIEDQVVTYTITTNKIAQYYKSLGRNITVKVAFDITGSVDVNKTMQIQTDAGYGKTWTIENLGATSEGPIEIKILIAHQDPLVVTVNTYDEYTGKAIGTAEYRITESFVLPATGNKTINVGYALENGAKTYKLKQTKIGDSYNAISEKTFNVTYVNEVIDASLLSITDNDSTEKASTITKTSARGVTINVYAKPKVPFEITNLDYFNRTIALQGANFKIEEIGTTNNVTGTTDSKGKVGIYTGKFGTNEDKIYKIAQTQAATGKATVEDFYVKVTYNSQNEITDAVLCDVNGQSLTTTNKFVTVTYAKTSTYSNYNGNQKGIVTIEVLNYPEFKINVDNVDRRDDATAIAGSEYEVTSYYTLSNNSQVAYDATGKGITDSLGKAKIGLNRTKPDSIIYYTVHEKNPGTGYQSLGADVIVQVTYDSEGYVSAVEIKNNNEVQNIASVSKKTPITIPEDNFEINLHLKNNPILKFNIVAEDSENNATKLEGLGFQMSSSYNNQTYSNSSATNRVNNTGTPETVYTDKNGETKAYLDRTLENKDMIYTIKEVKKSSAYEWIGSEIKLKISYDADGKISSKPVATQSNEFVNVVSYDANNFEVSLEIFNKEIKEFGINLIAEDAYDKDKKINDLNVEAFLTGAAQDNYVSDGNYELVGNDSLLTGADRDNNGQPDIAYGEDYKKVKEYTEGAGTRTLRLVIKNKSTQGHYTPTGYYKGTQYVENAYYQTIAYQALINVTFNDNGVITDASVKTGDDIYIGWLMDSKYLSVTHSNYMVTVKLKLYPMFNLDVNAMNNYTYQKEIDSTEKPNKLTGSKYTISTSRHEPTISYAEDYVTAGYIGYGHIISTTRTVHGNIYEATNSLFVPIEANKTRYYYVFEENEPTNYQKYRPRRVDVYQQRMVAIISIEFNELGEINQISKNYINRATYDNSTGNYTYKKPYNDLGGGYLSHNNLTEYNYYAEVTDNSNRRLEFYIGYALTTKITVTAKDDISGNQISHIKTYPFINNTYCTNKSYQDIDENYRYTNSNGKASWAYWGAEINNENSRYIIGSQREGSEYNGYYMPADLASGSIGGSGNEGDYYVKLDVAYNDEGKIANVTSIGKDLWGDDNTANITWDSETGNIYVDMLYSRKFQVTLNKVDYYDKTINKLNAKFDVISDKNLKTTINAMNMQEFGKIYKNTTVKYTLSETQIPNGYYPLQGTIDFYVSFDENGNIIRNKVISKSEYFGVENTKTNTEEANKRTADLTISIKNKPAAILDVMVIDKFYKNDGLENIYLNVTSSKGDKSAGNPQTDANGYANIILGPVYPNEKVTYTITQTNTAAGYYKNSTPIKLEVKYNDAGKIEEYKIISGDTTVNKFNASAYLGKRKISMQIMNMPKELNIGLYKYDKTTNTPMEGVPFTITKTNYNTGANLGTNTITTDSTGSVISSIDTFSTSSSGKIIKYVIHEDNTPETYRKTEDIAFLITYAQDGHMYKFEQIQNDNGIINTKVNLEMATNGVIKYLNNKRVHFKVTVPNDNAFDLIIKNEDINYQGLGIEGSKFDISINGTKYSRTTSSSGFTEINNITESGSLNIKIAQKDVGTGYKYDIDNNAEIILEKGTTTYSLDLDPATLGYIDDKNATTTKAIITVNEDFGTINVTFKNETKTELYMIKQDSETKQGLADVKFNVTAQRVDNTNNTITLGNSLLTDVNGMLYFDLGVAPQSQIWEYTFEEIDAPEHYAPINPVIVKVTYDQYGRIQAIENKGNDSNLEAFIADETNENCRKMYAVITNSDNTPTYTIKTVTVDKETGKRINDSGIYMNITEKQTGNDIPISPVTPGSANNGQTSKTGNISTDGKKYTDELLNAARTGENAETYSKEQLQGASKAIIKERGATYIDNIDYEGSINIEVSQQQAAEGYTYGSQITNANIGITTKLVAQSNGIPTIDFTVDSNDTGILLNVDNKSRIITITIYNESRVNLGITTILYGKEGLKIADVNYVVTSTIETATSSIPTDLNVTTPLTNDKGQTSANIGEAYAGKTIVYNIHQNVISGYEAVDDIKIEVKYDSRGYIKYYELLSSEDFAYIEDTTKGRQINLVVKTKKEVGDYTVQLEKHAMDTDNNESAYDILLQGAEYEITVIQEEHGTRETKWTGTTNEYGIIDGLPLNGYGYITITIQEIKAPLGYKIGDTKTYRVYRDRNTGEVQAVDAGVNIGNPNKDWSIIKVMPIDEQLDNKFTLELNKIVEASNTYITSSQAKFKTEIKQVDNNGNIIYQDTIGDMYTNKNGIARVSNIDIPNIAGEYELTITEEEAPVGYEKLKAPLKYNLKVTEQGGGKMKIESLSGDNKYASTLAVKDQYISLNIENPIDDQLGDDEYSLDITKVDAETGLGIEPMAVFKVNLPDTKNTDLYVETQKNQLGLPGKLEYCYIEENKDFSARLTHMKKPTVDQVKNAENEVLTYKYTFKEVAPPQGYALIEDPVELEVDFIIDTNEANEEFVKIKEARTSDNTILQIKLTTDTKVKADILNKEEISSYTVSYKPNVDASITVNGIPADQVKIAGASITLDGNIPTRDDGYEFVEWNTSSDGTGTAFNPGTTYGVDADLELYAQWKLKEFNIKYEANAPIDSNTGVAIGLVNNMPLDQVKIYGTDLTLNNDIPEITRQKDYYTFDSWNTKADGTGDKYQAGDTYTQNQTVTLYAQWNYNIIYEANVPIDENGFPMGSPQNIPSKQIQQINETTNPNISNNIPTMNGYKFKEWNTSADGTGTLYSPGDVYNDKKGIILYAIWQYEITYNDNKPLDSNGLVTNINITNMPLSPQTEKAYNKKQDAIATIASEIPLVDNNEYVFKEWNTKADGTGESYNPGDDYKGNKGIELYAIWNKNDKLYLKVATGSQYEIGENNKSIYEDGDKYIAKIIPQFSLDKKGNNIQKGTTVQEFKSNIETNAITIEIKDKDGNTLREEDLVGTGAMLHLSKDSENIDIAISAIGDLNGDGKITSTDVSEELIVYSKGKRDKTGETAKQYFTSTYPSATLNIDGEVMYKSSDLNDNSIGADTNDLSTIKLIYGLATGKVLDSNSGIDTIKLWRKNI